MHGNGCISSLENQVISGALLSKKTVAPPNTYVLKCAFSENADRYAVVLSNRDIHVFENDVMCAKFAHDKSVTDIKFSKKEPSLLMSSSLDGKINIWDCRCQKPVQTFSDDSDGLIKPLTCFDYNLNEDYICGGTELMREDSFLLFWDRRSSEILGGYWNSHTDEITQVKFHPTTNSGMASSSVDGLINIYDLNEQTEDDALMYTLNVGSAINSFSWGNSDILSCLTTIEEFQIWSATEASPTISVSREKLAENHQIEVDYLTSSITIADYLLLVTGSNKGVIHLWNVNNKSLNPVCCLSEGHSDVVRAVSYCSKENVILTGGEDGSICKWKTVPST